MKYEDWLNESITTPFGLNERRKCIKNFTSILYKFVESKGYNWKISEFNLLRFICNGLWDNLNKSHTTSDWEYSNVNSDYTTEDYDNYLYIFDLNTWENFWEMYGGWYDVDDNENFRAQDRRHDIQEFIWKQLDIPTSPQTHILNEILYNNPENEVALSPAVDMYMQESLEYNGWGGMRK